MDADSVRLLAAIVGPAFFGVLAFFAKGYFGQLRDELKLLSAEIHRLDRNIRELTVELAQANSDLRAIWRLVEGGRELSPDLRS